MSAIAHRHDAAASEADGRGRGEDRDDGRSPTHQFLVGLARAFGGAVIFGLPLLMTMEMWRLGSSMPRGRLALLLVAVIPLLTGLSAVSGFERTLRLKHDALDAFVAYAVGFVAAAGLLLLLGVLSPSQPLAEVAGMISLQAIPGSMGALLAESQFGQEDEEAEERREHAGYGGELFLMAVGALFLAFNIAPTEEIVLIAAGMTPWHALATVGVSLGLMHAFVYAVEFRGQASITPGRSEWGVFLRYTVAGYALVLLIAAYVLWTFGRTDGVSAAEVLAMVVVLGLPGAVGGAAARLLL